MYMRRTARGDTEVRGQTIHEGDKVALWYIAANHDPEVFENPHAFDVTRDAKDHEAFGGGGPHFCLGTHLAKLEIRVMFEELLARVPAHGARRRRRAPAVQLHQRHQAHAGALRRGASPHLVTAPHRGDSSDG